MVYKHLVKYNGNYYPAGTDVPVGTAVKNEKVEETKDFIVDGKTIGKINNDVIEITDEETINKNQISKTEINRMSTAELKEFASLNDVENAEKLTGGELKKILIEKFGL